MMNEIFNLRRFGKYLSADIRMCWSNYGLSFIALSLLVPIASYFLSIGLNIINTSIWNGPNLGFRLIVFGLAILGMVISMPVKCYGKITDKQYGSFWLSLPASALEKMLSMVILTCIVAPILGILIYLGTDTLICALDRTCGESLIAAAIEVHNTGLISQLSNLFTQAQLSSPWIWFDEIFCFTLPFLLGAIWFKKGKVVKTFIAIWIFSWVMGAVTAPFLINWAKEIEAAGDPNLIISQLVENGLIKNLALVDTISDTLFNLAMIAGILFRIKTLKH